MPDAVVVDAGKTLLNEGVMGAGLVLCLGAIVWLVKQWQAALKSVLDEKNARLADAKEIAALGEASRNAMAANTVAIQSVLDALRDRRRP